MPNPASQPSRLNCEPLKKLIREVPDFPKKGVLFYDITSLLKHKLGLPMLINDLAEHYIKHDIDLMLSEGEGLVAPMRVSLPMPAPARLLRADWA